MECSVLGCVRNAKSRGWCNTHYERWRIRGNTSDPAPPPKKPRLKCSVDECQTDSASRGMCWKHYMRYLRHGSPHGFATDDTSERFWAKVNRLSSDECWLWMASKDRGGYGYFIGLGEKRAHRASWAMHNGPIPQGMFVLHSCDNPPCVNPHHLSLGDVARNSAEAKDRGRTARGERQHSAKATMDDVIRIRREVSAGGRGTMTRMAREYGMSVSAISHICSGRSWKYVG